MKYLLDTDILSNLMRQQPSTNLIQHLQVVRPSDRAISAITLGELMYGALRILDGQKYLPAINDLAKQMRIIPFDEKAARRYSEVRVLLTRQGNLIGDADLQIACTALVRGFILVTRNVRHFSRVPRLKVENWIDS